MLNPVEHQSRMDKSFRTKDEREWEISSLTLSVLHCSPTYMFSLSLSLHPFASFFPTLIVSHTLLPSLLFSFCCHKAVFYSHSWRASHLFSLWNKTPTLNPDQETGRERETDRLEYNRGDLSPHTDVEISEIVSRKIRFVISAYWYGSKSGGSFLVLTFPRPFDSLYNEI